jgi:phosphate transport system substrate-binding protein
MKNIWKIRSLAIAGLAGLAIMATLDCGKSQANSLKIEGSDTMVQLAQLLAQEYMSQNPGHSVTVNGGGSGTGIASLLNGNAHIANASRTMKEKEWDTAKTKNLNVTEHIVGYDALAIIVHPENKISHLTIEQLSDIYSGKITNWKDVGGNDAPILAISRDSNSGTHVYFKETALRKGDEKAPIEFGEKITYATTTNSIMQQVTGNPAAIGYVGMGWLDKNVKTISIVNSKDKKAYAPTLENALKKKYPLARSLQMYTNNQYAVLADPFIKFVKSPAGQKVVQDAGFVPGK